VVAFPTQIDSCRAVVRIIANAQNRCFNFGFHAHSFLLYMKLDGYYLSSFSRLRNGPRFGAHYAFDADYASRLSANFEVAQTESLLFNRFV
jgi:hypothetical protein